MTQGKKDSLVYHSYTRVDTVMQIVDYYKTPMRGKESCTCTLMAKRDRAEYHVIQRHREFTLKSLQVENREVREGSTCSKCTKITFIVQG